MSLQRHDSLTPTARATDAPLVISFYTRDTIYEEEAASLIASCRALDLECDVRAVDSLGSWVVNCAHKPAFIAARQREHNRPILWVDADAVVNRPPNLLASTDADFAVYRLPDGSFASGTVFFGTTEAADALLQAWVRLCDADPTELDQVHLATAWQQVSASRDITTLWLPEQYTKVFDQSLTDPVIEHFQASRRANRADASDDERPADDVLDDVQHAPEDRLAQLRKARDNLLSQTAWLRDRLVEQAARTCVEHGYRRIALYGAGKHSLAYARQPWRSLGIEVVAVLDDDPKIESLSGVRVCRPESFEESVDAVVVSSDAAERQVHDAAKARFGPLGIPVLRIYGDAPEMPAVEPTVEHLVRAFGLTESDARWLVENRAERHDATLPMLPPARTELHLRRYELAAKLARGRRIFDIACGTGYGGPILVDQGGAAAVLGFDMDARTVRYAEQRFGRAGVIEFTQADAADTGLPDASADLIVSFETIEHIADADGLAAEFRRLLKPGGKLVLTTPNQWKFTDHHVHSFSKESLAHVLRPHFPHIAWWGQRPGNEPRSLDLPAGIYPLRTDAPRPDTLIVVATAGW
ncbi:MAG: methyltransferase domain-containing protein [Phycisphaerales bacterium]|nr:methyltransferase domain-containing protein [Phycisphaerales bacterium]